MFEQEAVFMFILGVSVIIIVSFIILLFMYLKTKAIYYKYFLFQTVSASVSFLFFLRCMFNNAVDTESAEVPISITNSASLGFCGIALLVSVVFFFNGVFRIYEKDNNKSKGE